MSYTRYSSYKNIELPLLGEMPAHWDLKRLQWVSSINDDELDESTAPDYQIEYVEISSLDGMRREFSPQPMLFKDAPSRARRKANHGDVAVSTVRTYLRAVAPVSNPSANLVFSTGFAIIRPTKHISKTFLKYELLTSLFIEEVIASSVGVSYPAINARDIGLIKVLVPPKDEQLSIASFLDSELAKADGLVAEQQRLISLLKEKRQAIISHAVTKGLNPDAPMKESGVEWLGKVPDHWDVMKLGVLFREIQEAGQNGLPILSVSIHSGVSDRQFDEEELDRKVARSEDLTKYKRVAPGDLTYNMMRAWQGGFGAVSVDGMVSPAYVVARPRFGHSSHFVEQVLRSPCAVEEMRRYSSGVTDFRLRLYWEEFKSIQIAIPPPAEVEQILEFIAKVNARTENLMNETARSISLLQERRSALISAAVTGKIDVRNYASPFPHEPA